jgi:pimeloyl-ACP methyl ester carboxylesterase
MNTPTLAGGAPRVLAAGLLLTLAACGGTDTPSGSELAAADSARGTTASPVDGLSIAWESVGTGPVALVFVHGWQCDRQYWREQLAHFAPDYRLLLIDLPGHGDSDGGREDWSMAAFGEDVAAVVRAEVAGPVVLIGHSMGGPVILEAAAGIERLLGLVAVDTLRDAAAPRADEASIAAALAPVEADYAGVVRGFVESMFVETTAPDLRARIVEAMTAGDPDTGIGMMRGFAQMDYPRAFDRLDVPVVLINSDYRPTPIEDLRALYPALTLDLIDGVGHFPMLEAPERFNARLDAALATLTAGAPGR